MIRKVVSFVVKAILPLAVVFGGISIAKWQINNKPEAEKQFPVRQARLVTAEQPGRGDYYSEILAMGTATPAQTVVLRPQVQGLITHLSERVIPGERVKKGDVLLKIDESDYKTALTQAQSNLDAVKATRDIEFGNRKVAEMDYALLGEDVDGFDKQLVLREPQLRSVEAQVLAASATLEKARLDLTRCTIVAPFNALIQTKSAELGQYVSPTSGLLELTGTDTAWIEALVPMEDLRWIKVPGAQVTLHDDSVWPKDKTRSGQVLRVLGTLEGSGRLAKLIVEVDDPFCLKPENSNSPKIMYGTYLRCSIKGTLVENVVKLDRKYLHDNDTVWTITSDGKLSVNEAEVLFRHEEYVLVSGGLPDGEPVITSNLSAPVNGMDVRTEEQGTALTNAGASGSEDGAGDA
ncbi:MAG: efflux RND transporter periplasmic adaptor subunit [Phycisphaerae bacterium]